MTEEARMVAAYQPLVKKLADRYRHLLNFEDGVSVGNIGLIEAIRAYDPDGDVKFGTVAYMRIRGRIIDEIRALYGKNKQRYQKTDPIDEGTSESVEYIETGFAAIESHIDVWRMLDGLPALEREIVVASFIRNETVKQIAVRLECSPHRITVLRRSALSLLRSKLQTTIAATAAG